MSSSNGLTLDVNGQNTQKQKNNRNSNIVNTPSPQELINLSRQNSSFDDSHPQQISLKDLHHRNKNDHLFSTISKQSKQSQTPPHSTHISHTNSPSSSPPGDLIPSPGSYTQLHHSPGQNNSSPHLIQNKAYCECNRVKSNQSNNHSIEISHNEKTELYNNQNLICPICRLPKRNYISPPHKPDKSFQDPDRVVDTDHHSTTSSSDLTTDSDLENADWWSTCSQSSSSRHKIRSKSLSQTRSNVFSTLSSQPSQIVDNISLCEAGSGSWSRANGSGCDGGVELTMRSHGYRLAPHDMPQIVPNQPKQQVITSIPIGSPLFFSSGLSCGYYENNFDDNYGGMDGSSEGRRLEHGGGVPGYRMEDVFPEIKTVTGTIKHHDDVSTALQDSVNRDKVEYIMGWEGGKHSGYSQHYFEEKKGNNNDSEKIEKNTRKYFIKMR